MQTTLSETILPNGMNVFYIKNINGEWEVPSTYGHIQAYFKYGIEVREGDVVFDVGANIGIFSLLVLEKCNFNATIYAFEPIPLVFEALNKNAQNSKQEHFRAFPVGISKESGSLQFTYYPNAPSLSTLAPEHVKSGLSQMIETLKKDPSKLPDFFKQYEGDNKLNTGNQERFQKMRAILGVKTLFQAEEIICEVKTLSSVMNENKISKINLLKVDTNGGEMDVFYGIAAGDWDKIEKIVCEVPQGGESLTQVENFLREKGFNNIHSEAQDAVMEELRYYILYALR